MTRFEKKRKQKIKALFVTESFPPESYGGGEISCSLLAQALAGRDEMEVTVLTSKVEGEEEFEKRGKVKVIRRLKTGGSRSSFKGNLKRRFSFKRSVKKELEKMVENYDLVHFFNITSIVDVQKPSFATINSYVNFCPKGNLFYKDEHVCNGCASIKFMGCITNSEYVGGYKLNPFLKYNPFFWLAIYLDYLKRKKGLKDVDHFFSLSGFIDGLLTEKGVPPGDITKVLNMPDIEKSDGVLDLPKNGVNVSFIGQLSKIKGVALLITSFKELDKDANLIIVGDGPEREKLEGMAAKNPNIMFFGEVGHELIHSIYEQSDVIVLPSLWPEPLSRVLLEAAYFGKPVVATDVGGSPEVIKHGYNGLLAEPEVDDLRNKLRYIIDEGEKRKLMEKNMKKYYRKNLSKDKILDKMIKTYKLKLGKNYG
ncbi:MAG: glycosyltransferase family 4 protein [Thermoplasmata archaeon]